MSFKPKPKTEDADWKGEALIDTQEFEPVLVTTALGWNMPGAVKVLLGTDIQHLGFKITYKKVADGVWSLARQSMVAERVDDAVRAQAMNLYGAAQRIGRVFGPLLTSLVILFGPVSAAYLLHIVLADGEALTVPETTLCELTSQIAHLVGSAPAPGAE